MSKLSSLDQVIATIYLDDDYYVAAILPGNATVEDAKNAGVRNLEPMSVQITEGMVLKLNVFMRAKWERIKTDLDAEIKQRKSTPTTA